MTKIILRSACTAAILAVTLSARAAPKGGAEAEGPWVATLDRVSHAVIAISVSTTRSLDTENASFSYGTGFVVDRARGLVLTNRHMVKVGPVRAKGTTLNHEEVELLPVYRDPVHDFGFYRFDPSKLRRSRVEELALAPEQAKVGIEIKVVGNDAGEKLSILGGTLARLDRPAPKYGQGTYNDFNTFYYQAATSTSGGSSGSPVVDVKGDVIALNAGGGRKSATSFYLPVDQPRRILDLLRSGAAIPRGTLQAVYAYEPFDELRRLGLRPETEQAYRAAHDAATGMLVVRQVVPGGPADGKLKPGDIIARVDGRWADSFNAVEETLDAKVGREVAVEVERAGAPQSQAVRVDDLHTLTPSRFLEFSRAVLQDVSLQAALGRNVPAKGVLVASPGYAFMRAGVPEDALIVSVDDEPVADIAAIERVLAKRPDGETVRVKYRDIKRPREEIVAVLTIDRRWFPMQQCVRNDATGFWDCRPSSQPDAAPRREEALSGIDFEKVKDLVGAKLAPSLVHVRFTMPYGIEGTSDWAWHGAGVVVDAARGLVLTDRGTVPILMGDAELTFAGSVRVPAEVVYLHPIHNVAVLKYDPARVKGLPVKGAVLRPGAGLDAGSEVWQVGLTKEQHVIVLKTKIAQVEYPSTGVPSSPQFRERNTEMFKLAEKTSTIGGVLADAQGRLAALWVFDAHGRESERHYGLPIEAVADAVEPLRKGDAPRIAAIEVETAPVTLAKARDEGLPAAWVARLAAADPARRQALAVVRAMPGTAAAAALAGGDIVVAIDGNPLTRPRQLEALAGGDRPARVLRLRGGKLEEVAIAPSLLGSAGVSRAAMFAGALFHEPHAEARFQYGVEGPCIYHAFYYYGGPVARSELHASLVREVDGRPVGDLDAFMSVVKGLKDAAPVRIRTENLVGVQDVKTLEIDLVYWPTYLVERGGAGWKITMVR